MLCWMSWCGDGVVMPNVTRGDRAAGLMCYLVGEGKRNEHTDPHLVAGDGAMLAWHDDNQLGKASAMAIARHLERPNKVYGVDVQGGHVWHCSLSLRADEGELSDERWQEIANDFVSRMGFDDQEGTKAPCRWVAVRHGLSTNGNDHIHVVVNLVREDGTKAAPWRDYKAAQDACRELEKKYGLMPVEGPERGQATRGYHPAEAEAQARSKARAKYDTWRAQEAEQGRQHPVWRQLPAAERGARMNAELSADQPRVALARAVRGCAAAAKDEAEFVRRMRQQNLLVRPRYADGGTDVITGYSVAARPVAGERPIWYGGNRLGRDLSLPRLRSTWEDTPQGAQAAADEWAAAKRGKRPAAPGRETRTPPPAVWEKYQAEMAAQLKRLATVPPGDTAQWQVVARDAAGAFAAWSARVEPTPGALARTADELAKSAQTKRPPGPQVPVRKTSIAASAMLLAAAGSKRNSVAAEAALIAQLLRTAAAIRDMRAASGQVRRQAALDQLMRQELVKVAQAYTTAVSKERDAKAGAAQQHAITPVQASFPSPLPGRLTPEDSTAQARPTRADPARGRGRGR